MTYGVELMQRPEGLLQKYDVHQRAEIVELLLPYYRGDNTEGLIESARKIVRYIEEG
jgi:hypothetical protein